VHAAQSPPAVLKNKNLVKLRPTPEIRKQLVEVYREDILIAQRGASHNSRMRMAGATLRERARPVKMARS